MSRRLIIAAFTLVAGLPLLAQQGPDSDPDAAQGYVNNVFHHSDVDSINLYNGQLTVPIAVGPSYPIGPKLKFQAMLTYTSRAWEYGYPPYVPPNLQAPALPFEPLLGDPALGIGWNFNMGAIKPCSVGQAGRCYVSPDGAEHLFNQPVSSSTFKTEDTDQFLLHYINGSSESAGYEMWDGDGNHYVFGWSVTGFDDISAAYIHDFGRGRNGWYLTSLTDPFGNGITVNYYSRAAASPCPSFKSGCPNTSPNPDTSMRCAGTGTNSWVASSIQLPGGVTISIGLDTQPGTAQMIKTFTFPVFAGGQSASAVWTLNYQTATWWGGGYCVVPLVELAWIDLPATLPGALKYLFQYASLPDGLMASTVLLTKMTMPTGASVQYDYGDYSFYHGRIAALNAGCTPKGPPADAWVIKSSLPSESRPIPSLPIDPCVPAGWADQTYIDARAGVLRKTEVIPIVSGPALTAVTNYTQYAFPFGEQGTSGTSQSQSLTVVAGPPDIDNHVVARSHLFWAGPTSSSFQHCSGYQPLSPCPGDRTGGDLRDITYDSDPYVSATFINQPACGGANDYPFCANHAVRVAQRTYDYDDPLTQFGNRRLQNEITYHQATAANGSCSGCKYHTITLSNLGGTTWDGNGRHYNIETHLGNLGGDFRQVVTTWSPTISPWFPNLFDKRITSDATGSLNQYFDYDHITSVNGFLRGTLTWDSGRSLLFADCRYATTSQGIPDGHGNVASRYMGTFAWTGDPPDPHSCSLLRPYPASWGGSPGNGDVFATDFTYQNGQRVSARAVNGSSPGAWLKYDVTRDSTVGWVTSSRDTAGLQTSYLYDSVGRPTTITPPGEAATNVGYPSAVQTIATRNGGAGLSTYEVYDYDGLGRTVRDRRLMPAGTYAKRFTKFDPAGNAYFESEWVDDATSETVSPNLSTSCSFSGGTFSTSRPTSAPGTYRLCYDPFGRARQVVGSMHSSLQTISRIDGSVLYSDTLETTTTACVNGTYSGGSCSGGTDSTTTTREDAFGRSTSVIEPNGEPNGFTTSYGYDVNGKLTSVAQGAQSRSFSYDRFGFLRSETTPEKGMVTYDSIGSLGNVRHQTEPGGLVLSRAFDYAGRLTGVSSSEPRTYLTNTYDEATDGIVPRGSSLGKLTTSVASNYYPSTGFTTAFFPGGKVTDSLYYSGVGGRLSQKKTTLSNGSASTVEGWTYNGLGLVATESYPRIDSTGVFSVTTSYTAGLPTAVSAPGQSVVTSATYNPAGGLASYTAGNGIMTTIVPDPNLMPRPRQIYTSDGNFDTGNYVYDGRGNIRSQGLDVFEYDTNSRLLKATYPPTVQSYVCDEFGNLVKKAGTDIGVDRATNRLNGPGVSYDSRGNLTLLAGENYSYDALNRQARHDAPTSHWSYLLDGANERIVKAIPPGGLVARREMARIILQAMGQQPLTVCKGYFSQDVPCTDPERGWIEKFYEMGITAGCIAPPNGNFCANGTLTRWQMAVFISVAKVWPSTVVPASGTVPGVGSYNCTSGGTSLFADVLPTDVGCKFIHYIYAQGVTAGCSVSPRLFCPNDTTPHDQMEVFVSQAWTGFKYVPPGATYTFRGAGSSVLTEYQDSKVSKDYVYLGSRLVGTNDSTAGVWKFHATDHLGSVRVTWSSLGVERRKYWPWGEDALTPTTGRMAFAGMELDLEATRPRYYDHARNLETGNGRFLSPDLLGGKIADPQSWNRYTYARNNPLKYVDRDGKSIALAAALPALGSLPLTPPQMVVLTASTSIATGLWIGQQTVGGMTINEGVTRFFTELLTLDMKSATKPGAADGPTAGKRFPPTVQDQAAGQATDANGQTKCQNCGVPTGTEAGQIPGQTDHIIPKSQGGDATIDNAQHVCQTCNASAGAREQPGTTGAEKIRRVPPDPEQR